MQTGRESKKGRVLHIVTMVTPLEIRAHKRNYSLQLQAHEKRNNFPKMEILSL